MTALEMSNCLFRSAAFACRLGTPMKAPKPLPRISAKKLQSLGGSVPFSSITGKRKPIKKGGRPKRKKRDPDEDLRIHGPQAFRDWLHEQPCVVSGLRGNIECVHVVTGGMGRKADWTLTVPMAGELHRELHRIGVKSFEAKHNTNLMALAAKTRAQYIAHEARNGQ